MIKNFLFVFYVEVLIVTAFNSGTGDHNGDVKIVIDNDAGADDGMAIFLKLLYEKYYNGPKLIALTTTNGNTVEKNVNINNQKILRTAGRQDAKNVNINNQKILRTAGRQDVPIYRGSNSSLVITQTETEHFFGVDGLGNNDEPLTGLVPARQQPAVETLLLMSRIYAGKLIVIIIGTLTNVALAIKVDPEFMNRIAHLYVGGGHIEYDWPEFNARMDAEAYHIVTQYATPEKVTLVPFSQVYEFLHIDKEWRLNTFGKIDTEIVRALNRYESISMPKVENWYLLDPLVVAIALSNVHKELGFITEYKYSNHSIILDGERRGITVNKFVDKEEANVRIAYSFEVEKYKEFLMDLFTAELREVGGIHLHDRLTEIENKVND